MATARRSNAPRFVSIELTNFLSYKSARLDLGDFVALVGPNSSGKSNVVKAVRLLRAIPAQGLPTAIARLGGFDQLRHRSAGHPYNPAIKLRFGFEDEQESSYELSFSAVKGKRYEVKYEAAEVYWHGRRSTFVSNGDAVTWESDGESSDTTRVGPGQSAITAGGNFAAYVLYDTLRAMQTVEVNPALIRDLQQPSSVTDFEPDGSNVVSVFESLSSATRARLTDELATIVPGIARIEVQNLADRQTLKFAQSTASGTREFTARQMSDGTLRAFSILLATMQNDRPSLLVIEEPEMAIHLGAMRTLVELLRARTPDLQVLITTHSADILDSLPLDALRVVTNDGSSSQISPIAKHTIEVLRRGLVSPGELLRLNALDPATS